MASFPWVGWTITTILVPVFLLLLFHLSGWFFTRSLPNEGPAQRTEPGKETPIPKNVELVYSVISNAPVLVVLLGLIALGGALFVLDTALGTLRPYIPWILGSVTLFLIVCYIARLIFLAKHHKTEKEYAYRMQIFRETGVIITEKNLIPLTAEQIASAANALPEGHAKTEEPEAGENAGADTSRDDAHEDNIIDATIVEKEPKKP
ncbi:MAG: hypothetical protein IJS54_04760 [Desulfovibrio sp.]|nr:hypothetical protein [Desulfovibrio sp.]